MAAGLLTENEAFWVVDWGLRMNIIRALAADFLSIPRLGAPQGRAGPRLDKTCIDA
jgi:hypothetical protein